VIQLEFDVSNIAMHKPAHVRVVFLYRPLRL